jgi:hypothetical protein
VLSYEPKQKYIKHKITMSWDNHHNIAKHEIKLMRVGRRDKIMPKCVPTSLLYPSLNRVVIRRRLMRLTQRLQRMAI